MKKNLPEQNIPVRCSDWNSVNRNRFSLSEKRERSTKTSSSSAVAFYQPQGEQAPDDWESSASHFCRDNEIFIMMPPPAPALVRNRGR